MGNSKPPLNPLEKSLIIIRWWFIISFATSFILIGMAAVGIIRYLRQDTPQTPKVPSVEAPDRLEQEGSQDLP